MQPAACEFHFNCRQSLNSIKDIFSTFLTVELFPDSFNKTFFSFWEIYMSLDNSCQ